MIDSEVMKLSARARNSLTRAGIETVQQLIDSIEQYGLVEVDDGFILRGAGPLFRNVGRVAAKEYRDMLERVGFDYRKYLSTPMSRAFPKTLWQYNQAIESKVNELIELLKEYNDVRKQQTDGME